MRNLRALANSDFAIHQGAMRRLYGEGTGSVIDEEHSDPFQGVPRVWILLRSATSHLQEDQSATTGVCVVFIRNQIYPAEVFDAREPIFEAEPVARSPALVLDRVREVFGLNISETAEVFYITRQTAYQWMKFTDMEQVRSHENRDRLKQLYGAAQAWRNFPPLKGRWLHALLPAGITVFDLLKAARIDLDALQAAYQALTNNTADRRRDEGKRATQAAAALAGAFAGIGAGRRARKG